MASERTIARIQAQIQRRVAHCLQFELADPRASFVTVVRVELNTDMSTAKIYYSVLGDDAEKSKSAQMLEHAKGFIRRQVGSVLRTKTVPNLKWIFDESIAQAEHIDDLLERTKERDRQIREGVAPDATEPTSAGSAETGPSETGPSANSDD